MDTEYSLEAIQDALSDLQTLLKSAGWERLCRFAQQQLATRRDSIELTPLQSMDAVLEQEYKKGEIAGIRLFCQLPVDYVESLKHDLQQLEQEREDETKDE